MNTPGQFAECIPCAAGHFADTGGSPACSECSENEYQNETGHVSCRPCPANTRRFSVETKVFFGDNASAVETVESTAASVNDCKCLPGFWLRRLPHGIELPRLFWGRPDHPLDVAGLLGRAALPVRLLRVPDPRRLRP